MLKMVLWIIIVLIILFVFLLAKALLGCINGLQY